MNGENETAFISLARARWLAEVARRTRRTRFAGAGATLRAHRYVMIQVVFPSRANVINSQLFASSYILSKNPLASPKSFSNTFYTYHLEL